MDQIPPKQDDEKPVFSFKDLQPGDLCKYSWGKPEEGSHGHLMFFIIANEINVMMCLQSGGRTGLSNFFPFHLSDVSFDDKIELLARHESTNGN